MMAQEAGMYVSHAHEDHAWCRTFVEALRLSGANVWYDEHNLGYGALDEEIEQELGDRPIFIVILSPASVRKPWVRREMDTAIRLRDENPERVILPVIAEKTEIPLRWWTYERVCGPGDTAISLAQAAARVIDILNIVPTEVAIDSSASGKLVTAEEAAQRGNGLYSQKRYQKALAAYEQALALAPKNAEILTQKGNVLYDLHQPGEALSAYEQALALDSLSAGIWNNKGNALAALQRNEEALTAYEQGLALDPQAADIWNNKGTVLQSLYQPDEALVAYEQALGLDPGYAVAWNNKGIVLQQLQRPEEALAAYEQALALDPGDADVWNNMIEVFKQLGRTAEAQEAERERDEALGSQ
jgi:tetratricopeptide (TPR) repeat protein